MRTEPAPSEPTAAGTMPAATAEAEPPLEPPGVWSKAPGVAGGAKRGALGEGVETDLGGVGLADDDRAGGAQAADHLAVLRLCLEGTGAAEGGGVLGEVDVVLDRDGDAQKR